jgi:Ca2+-binding EF-hand superfamily protein
MRPAPAAPLRQVRSESIPIGMDTVACYRHASDVHRTSWGDPLGWSMPLRRPATGHSSSRGSDGAGAGTSSQRRPKSADNAYELQREPSLMGRLREYQGWVGAEHADERPRAARGAHRRRGQQQSEPRRRLRAPVARAARTSMRHARSANPFGQPSSTFREVAGFRVYSKDPLVRAPLKPGDACEIFLRSSASWVKAVCLQLKGAHAHCAFDLSLAGMQWVRTDQKGFREVAHPEQLSHILRKCWARKQTGAAGPEQDWASTSKKAGFETLGVVAHRGKVFGQPTKRHQQWSSQGYAQTIRVNQPSPYAQQKQKQKPRATAAGHGDRAGAQAPLGIGQSTIQGIKRFIVDKVEQNHVNIRPVFRKFDEDKSGHLSYDEFRRGLLHMGIPLNDKEFRLLCKEVDNDGSGSIGYDEFVEDMKSDDKDQTTFHHNSEIRAAKPRQAAAAQAPLGIGQSTIQGIKRFIVDKVEQNHVNIRPVFRKFDEDKSGHLSYDEFRRGLLHMGIPLNDKEFRLLCKEVDNDDSGSIGYDEFVEDMKSDDKDRKSWEA